MRSSDVCGSPTFQRCVESEASGTDNEEADECDQEDPIMPILPAVVRPLHRQTHEVQVGQGIDDFSGIVRSIVVLTPFSMSPIFVLEFYILTSSHQSNVEVMGAQ